MEDGVHVKHFVYHREEDAIRKTLGQNATDFALGTNDPEKVRIPSGAIRRKKNLVDQFRSETWRSLLIPGRQVAASTTSSTESGRKIIWRIIAARAALSPRS